MSGEDSRRCGRGTPFRKDASFRKVAGNWVRGPRWPGFRLSYPQGDYEPRLAVWRRTQTGVSPYRGLNCEEEAIKYGLKEQVDAIINNKHEGQSGRLN